MKTTLTVLFASLMTLTAFAQGDNYKTLSGYKDSIQIPAGQTAFVVSASSRVVIGVERPGKHPLQFKFLDPQTNCLNGITLTPDRGRDFLPNPSVNHPVPIAGPAKLILRTDGLITLTLPEVRRKTVTTSGVTVRRFAKN